MPGGQQCVNGGVLGAGPLSEAVPGRQRELDGFLSEARSGSGSGVAGTRARRQWRCWGTALGGFAQVVPQMPPVRDLDRLRRPGCGAFCEERRPVPADDLDTGPLGKPGGQARCFSIRQEIDRTAGFDVHQDSAVAAALAGGVLVDADHPRCRHLRLGQRLDQPQDRTPADGHAEHGSQAGADSTDQGKADRGQGGTQPLGALAILAGQAGYLLHERPARALGIPAPEPPDPQLKYDASPGARDISEKPQVGAVNPGRADSASREGGASHRALCVDALSLDVDAHRQHRDVRIRRE